MLTPLFVVSANVALIFPECSQDKNLLALRVHPTHLLQQVPTILLSVLLKINLDDV